MANAFGKIIANVERLHRLMDEAGVSAIVARSGKNFTYLAGFAYPGTLARHLEFPDSPREVLLVWPRLGEPTLALNSYAAPLARRDSWLERIEVVDDYAESPYRRAADVLRQMGLAEETIGFEKSYVSANRWEEIGRLLPKARLVDSTELMDRVRWIKTPEEVAALEAGARLLDEAYLEALPTVRPGDTERLVHSRIIESCLRRGANWAHGILNSSRNTVGYGGESDLPFQAGDIIRNDYVAYLNGYPGHQSRSVCVGPPSDEQKRTYRVVRDIYRATIDRCLPGARTADIYHFANDAFHEAGFPGNVALAGHGVGAWWHQQEPYMVPSSERVLEEGMVVALEPHIGPCWHLQDMALVTEDGPRLLSPLISTDEMLVAG